MTIPVELTLVSGPNGPRLQALPVEEIKGQVRTTNTFRNLRAQGGDLSVAPLSNGAQLIDITWKSTGGLSGIRVPGVEIQHDSRAGKLFINKMGFDVPKEGEIRLKMILDRGSAEVFLGKGDQALSLARDPKLGEGNLTLIPGDRMMEVVGLTVSELAPARKPLFKDTP